MPVQPRATAVLPALVEEVVAAPLVPTALLRSVAVQRQALLRLGRTAHVRHIEVLDLTDGGDIRIVRSASSLPSVGEVLRTSGRLPGRDAALVVVQAAQALRDGHELGLAHASLSPDRLLITGPGEVRLDGFGVLAELDACLGLPADRLAARLPEAERRRATATTDTFVLASLFLALVTAEPVHAGDVMCIPADLPEDLAAVLEWSIAADPGERPRPGVLAASLAEWSTSDRPVPAARPAAVPGVVATDRMAAPAPALGPLVVEDAAPAPARTRGRMPWGKVAVGVAAAVVAVSAGRVLSGDPGTGLDPAPTATTVATAEAPVTTTTVASAAPVEAITPPPAAPVVEAVPVVPDAPAAGEPVVAAPSTTVAPARTTSTRRAAPTTSAAPVVEERPPAAPEAAPAEPPTTPAPAPVVELTEPAFDGAGPGSVGSGSSE